MKSLQLMCVSNKHQTHPEMPVVPIGNEVTAIDEYIRDHRQYWQLKEFPGYPLEFWYHKADFAILPDQSADELREEKHEALIYQR